MKELGETTLELRRYLACKAFDHTASYDTQIERYLSEKGFRSRTQGSSSPADENANDNLRASMRTDTNGDLTAGTKGELKEGTKGPINLAGAGAATAMDAECPSKLVLRYGMNPHQKTAFLTSATPGAPLPLTGMPLPFTQLPVQGFSWENCLSYIHFPWLLSRFGEFRKYF